MPKPSDASVEEIEFEEDDTVTDFEAISKLLDVPDEDLNDDIGGLLLVGESRNGGTVFVPYINMIIDVEGDEPAFVSEKGEQTVLQMIDDSIKHLKK